MSFSSITQPVSRSRGQDRHGSGQFGAPRGTRLHRGLDVKAQAGESIYSPIYGDVVREAIPYAPFTGILIRGVGEHAGYEVKLFYVEGTICGRVRPGDLVGVAQDLTHQYPGITNHVHMEIRKNGAVIDPLKAYQMSF